MKKRKYLITSSLLAASLFTISPALAATTTQGIITSQPAIAGTATEKDSRKKNGGGGAVGTVSAINGTSITLAGKNGTTYTVDVTNAKITKAKSVIQPSGIAVGDTLFVGGTLSGTSITAKVVMDGVLEGSGAHHAAGQRGNFSIGTVSAINGSSFTISIKGRQHATTTPAVAASFTVNTTSSTTFKEGGQASSLSSLTIGQYVAITGTKDAAAETIDASKVNILTVTSTRAFGRNKAAK
jgi:hypothetical protein